MNSNNNLSDSTTEDGIGHSSQTSPIRSLGVILKIEKGLSTIHRDFLVDGGDTATTIGGSRGNPITELVSSATTQIASPPRIRAGRSIITTPVTRDSEALVLYSPNATTLVGKTHPREDLTIIRPINETSTDLDICIHADAVSAARLKFLAASSSSAPPPSPERPKKKQKNNTTIEKNSFTTNLLFVLVRQKRLGTVGETSAQKVESN